MRRLSSSLTRRDLLVAAALSVCRLSLPGQTAATLYPSTRPDVASIDHDRILSAATRALAEQPAPLTRLPAPQSPGTPQDFFSSASFTAHSDALFALGRRIAALTAAFHLTPDPHYASHAAAHLHAWFVDPATRMTPRLPYAQVLTGKSEPNPEGLLDSLPLVEIAQALPFFSTTLANEERAALKAWFTEYLHWLTTTRSSGLARDRRDHHASSWLLQAATYAHLTGNGTTLDDLSHRFKSFTLRSQIVADGGFPHELETPYPYRNSLFNLELLSAACVQISSQFENLWDFELQDGPGLRVAVARHFPFIQSRDNWPYRADLDHFTDLPVRGCSLLFAARVYSRPEYAALWKTLNPDPSEPVIQRTLPISQPLLWVIRPPSLSL